MKKYYLMVRYKDTNEVQVVELNAKWYLDNQGENAFFRANSLEAIDLVTTRFRNREEMLDRMVNNGYIRSSLVDVFIASKRKKKEKSYIKIHEVIYNPECKEIVINLRDIAKASIKNDISSEIDKVKNIFDILATKVFYNEKFSLYLRSTFTNVYQRIMELYVYNSKKDGPDYSVKYDNYWLLSSYTIIRNIVESLNRFDLLKDRSDVVLANIEFLNENGTDRKRIENELLIKLDENYIDGQYSLFDKELASHIDDVSKSTYSGASKEEKKKEKIGFEQKSVVEELSYEDKKIFIFETIRSLPTEIFFHSEAGVIINADFFNKYPNSSYKRNFVNLSKRTVSMLYYYALHQEKYLEALRFNQSTMTWDEELRKDSYKISKFLKQNKNIDKLNDWCNNYLKCVEFETLTLDLDESFESDMEEGKNFGNKK